MTDAFDFVGAQADGYPTLLFFPAGNKSFDPVRKIHAFEGYIHMHTAHLRTGFWISADGGNGPDCRGTVQVPEEERGRPFQAAQAQSGEARR